jgi:hypothetical protein
LTAGHRYRAACAASLAGGGQGAAADLDGQERARLREQALGWLRADLAQWETALSDPSQARAAGQRLRGWQTDPNLAGLREDDALENYPEAERKAFRQLWHDVETLRTRLEATGKGERP